MSDNALASPSSAQPRSPIASPHENSASLLDVLSLSKRWPAVIPLQLAQSIGEADLVELFKTWQIVRFVPCSSCSLRRPISARSRWLLREWCRRGTFRIRSSTAFANQSRSCRGQYVPDLCQADGRPLEEDLRMITSGNTTAASEARRSDALISAALDNGSDNDVGSSTPSADSDEDASAYNPLAYEPSAGCMCVAESTAAGEGELSEVLRGTCVLYHAGPICECIEASVRPSRSLYLSSHTKGVLTRRASSHPVGAVT